MKPETIEGIRTNNVQFPKPEQKAFQMLMACYYMGDLSYRKLKAALEAEDKYGVAEKYCGVDKNNLNVGGSVLFCTFLRKPSLLTICWKFR